tara:strand:- start:47 stop:547 length:501 start_codon:yes stop_codon:yes gene_type:complete
MWVVVKYKTKEFKTLKHNLAQALGDAPQFYSPKIRYQKYFKRKLTTAKKFILENYLICYHSNFKNLAIMSKLKYIKGLDYFLTGSQQNQKEIINFVEYCKSFEDQDGYLKQEFFSISKIKKAKFVSGPFTNIIFDVIGKNKNKLKVLIGNMTATIYKNSHSLYQPV